VRDGPRRARFSFSDRHGGVSTGPYASLNLGDHVGDDPEAVNQNRRILSGRLGIPVDRVVWMRQVHGANVAVVDSPAPSGVADVDAVVSAVPGLGLGVLVADCVPVVLADANAGVVGAAHAGRLGMFHGVVPAVVVAMQQLGAEANRLQVVLGPSVCGRCYAVPYDLQKSVVAKVPQALSTTRDGAPALDLAAGIRAQLRRVGVDHVETDGRCSVEDPTLFSYRRGNTTGRQAAVVWLDLA
jgi:polyphenol oxidase